jgi:ABC-type lipoprotein export system ATPase subunit
VLPSDSPLFAPPGGTVAVARAEQVSRDFDTPAGRIAALGDVDLDVPHTGVTVVTGPSGCGKTTLLTMFTAADRPDRGKVEVCGADVATMRTSERRALRRRDLGVVLSRPSDNLVDRLDLAANVRLAARLRDVDADVESVLAEVGLAARAGAPVWTLSGGEQQRAAIAIALLGSPRLVVMDEPTADLDHTTADGVVTLLATRSHACAVLVASHDPLVVDAADTLARLDRGRRVA